ncbi:unnamed protein product [Albugo candida]|uniref:tRNA-dihydrouridine(16/17) synthase [NAD(P)(+)] n=2 Tax=Albugo candida TaxID=65357 RepID=A0A024G5M5_9STRA|nr:unnamed protein product [Albugo candida]|eukprot:CCI42170.1 unnamed protein product [Albugo candida]
MQKLRGHEFFRSIGSPQRIVAPMVDQSELAFRMLCREHGAQLCYTPMFHSRLFAESQEYRSRMFEQHVRDRPLIVQFCGNDPETMVTAAKYVEGHCDAVDINLGCPQGIARKGNYGAFLMKDKARVCGIVEKLVDEVAVPVTCKIRVFPDEAETIEFTKMLEKAGCDLLVVHGRTKEMNKGTVGQVNWEIIKKIKNALSIPVIANGGIETPEDIAECLEVTGADGVMSSEAILGNPALFDKSLQFGPLHQKGPCYFDLANEYMDFVTTYPTGNLKIVRAHLFKLLFEDLTHHTDLRSALASANTFSEMKHLLQVLGDRKNAPVKYEYTLENIQFLSNAQGDIPVVRRTSGIGGNAWCVVTPMRVLFDKFDFVVVYLDDICIFSKTNEEDTTHLHELFEVLRHEKPYTHRRKCSFGKESVGFLGHNVSRNGLSVDKRKTSAIDTMAPPATRKELLSFLGLAGYNRRFICDFAKIALPLSEFVKKEVSWEWSDDQDEARDVHFRRHARHMAVLCLLPRIDQDLLLDMRDFSSVDSVHQVGVLQLQQRESHDQIQNIDFIISSIHLSSITKKAFMSGYTKDREFKETLNSHHDKYVLPHGLHNVKTNHAAKRLCVPADDRLIIAILCEHHDGNTAAHPGVRRTKLKVAQWYYWPTLEKKFESMYKAATPQVTAPRNGTQTTKTKLLAKEIGPFQIKKMINNNVAKLALPRNLGKLHPSLNIELLSHFVPNPVRFSSRPVPKAVPVIFEKKTGSELYIVEALVQKRVYKKQPEWLVEWHGLPEHECTWEK